MRIVKIISEHKRGLVKKNPVKKGFKRVEAIVETDGRLYTRHIEIKK